MDRLSRGTTLARFPPWGSLAQAGLLGASLYAMVYGTYGMITSKQRLLNPAEAGIFWLRVLVLAVLGLCSLWLLLRLLRLLIDWTLCNRGIYYRDGRILFRIPTASRWWHPWPRIQEADVPLQAIRDTCFDVHTESYLVIETEAGDIEVPSKVFAIGGYTLDRRIRELVSQASGAIAPVDPYREWRARRDARLGMVILSLFFLSGPLFLLMGSLPGARALQPLFPLLERGPASLNTAVRVFQVIYAAHFFMGLPLLLLACLYRGHVVLDSSGVFYERGGIVSFLSWKALAAGSIRRSDELVPPGLWTVLEMRSHSGLLRSPHCRIRLTQILGLGFPLREIEQAVVIHVVGRTLLNLAEDGNDNRGAP